MFIYSTKTSLPKGEPQPPKKGSLVNQASVVFHVILVRPHTAESSLSLLVGYQDAQAVLHIEASGWAGWWLGSHTSEPSERKSPCIKRGKGKYTRWLIAYRNLLASNRTLEMKMNRKGLHFVLAFILQEHTYALSHLVLPGCHQKRDATGRFIVCGCIPGWKCESC